MTANIEGMDLDILEQYLFEKPKASTLQRRVNVINNILSSVPIDRLADAQYVIEDQVTGCCRNS